MRALRRSRGITMKDMAAALEVSSAYLSALEHGRRGRPTWYMVQQIIVYFNVIWDEAEEIIRLADLSHPRVVIDTAGLDPRATEVANLLAERVAEITGADLDALAEILRGKEAGKPVEKLKRSG